MDGRGGKSGRKKKLGILTSRMRRGLGVDLTLHRIATELRKRRWDVTVFTIEEDGEYSRSGYDIVGLDIPHERFCLDHDRAAREKAAVLNEHAPDAWLVSAPPFYALAPLLNAPAIHLDHGISPTWGLSWKRRLNWKVMWFTQFFRYHNHAALVTTPSNFIRLQLPAGVRRRTMVTHWGSDHYPRRKGLHRKAVALREKLRIREGEVLLLYVGRLNPIYQRYKGVSELEEHYVSLKRKHEHARLLMVGLGEESDRQRLNSKGIDCLLLPPAEKMPEIYAACDAFVTCTKWEGFDLPLLEAQAFSRPVLAYRKGAHPEVARDRETGFLVDTQEEFHTRLQRLVRKPEQRIEMGVRAGSWAAEFTWGKVGRLYHELIGSVID